MKKDIETRIDIYLNPIFTNFALNAIGKHTVRKNYYVDCKSGTDGNFILFQLTLDGMGLFIQNNKTYRCDKNQLFICQVPSDAIYYLPKHSELWKVMYLEISIEFLSSFKNLINLNSKSPVINLTKYPYIVTLLQEIYNISILDKENNKAKLEKLSFDFITELFEIFNQNNKYTPKVQSIKNYIEANYDKDINLDVIAKNLYISKYYMIKKFKEQTSLTPMRFLIEYRLKVARTLLMNMKNSIEYVATSVGFKDSNYFTKVFKKKFNITPREYRFTKNNLI
ncbi:helix-turn-helix domain-containing protein [Caviibacter abscessus]|uniref:helix-turn-helix domain-containing protein n=1 Tax=Caviibacter abscessus TaxID=1766719 RepID=UPI00082A9C78|nr:AraC family transcriptional regulator [Caviibacter abscessus]